MQPDHARILAIETSSAWGSIALAEGPHLRFRETLPTTSKHCQLLLPTISGLCQQAGWRAETLDEIYVSAGPGSFTGLRIAVTVARTLALALGLKVVAVPTTHVVAARAACLDRPPAHLAVALDAKRQQVYGAVFRFGPGSYVPLVEACLLTPAELLDRSPPPVALTGEGLAYHAEAFRQFDVPWIPQDYRLPHAEQVHRIGWAMARDGRFTPPAELLPTYIRLPEAEERWAARHAHEARADHDRSTSA